MKYDAARYLISSGDLILFRGRGVFAWFIRKWTGSPYAHVAVAWKVGGRVLLLESRAKTRGVAIGRTLSGALEDGAHWLPTSVNWWTVPEIHALRDLGKPYGWLDAIRAGLGLQPAGRGLQCAEYAWMVLQAANPSLRRIVPTPGELARLFPRVPEKLTR